MTPDTSEDQPLISFTPRTRKRRTKSESGPRKGCFFLLPPDTLAALKELKPRFGSQADVVIAAVAELKKRKDEAP